MMPEQKRLSQPIFIVGTGRCGSTVFHRLMAEHFRVAFLTGFLNKFPDRLAVHRAIMHGWDLPVIGNLLRRFLGPSEGWDFWEHHVPGFRRPCRDLRADDVMPKIARGLLSVFSQLVTPTRSRLVIKLTGWTRIGFIKKVFPDAKIIHIIRDPQPVVSSMLNTMWWHGWAGPLQWRWGPLSLEEEAVWKRYDRSFLVLAAIEWKKIMEAYRESLMELPPPMLGDVLEIHYQDLCGKTEEVIREALSFTSLSNDRRFSTALARYNMKSQDHKWTEYLTEAQQDALNQALEDLKWKELKQGLSPEHGSSATGAVGFASG